MTTKYTPGKWETCAAAHDDYANGAEWDVCEAGGGDRICSVDDGEHSEEHARLIAAAPDMAAALREVLDANGDAWKTEEALRLSLDALVKAGVLP